MSETRRHALKLLGTIGATCAFPFAGDELYGQHVHVPPSPALTARAYQPAFFTSAEYDLVARLTDAIIPATDTPGASAAGVPEYIDRVVSGNVQHQALVRMGLDWLARESQVRFARAFDALGDAEQALLLRPLSDEVDRQRREALHARFRVEGQGRRVYYVATTDRTPPARPGSVPRQPLTPADPALPVEFFRLVKNLTADGYYTSRVGLLDELGYEGNAVLGGFPPCSVPEQ